MKAEVTSFAFDFLHTKHIARNYVVSGPIIIIALAAASPRRKVTIFGRRTSGHYGGGKEGPQGGNGFVKARFHWRRKRRGTAAPRSRC